MTDIENPKKLSSWMIALKEYNKQVGNGGKFIVPKKGSEEHSKVVDIMNKYKTDNNIVTKPKKEPKKKKEPEPVVTAPPPLEVVEPVKKGKTVRKKKTSIIAVSNSMYAPDSGITPDISNMSKEELIKELLSKI
jgi:hypothetical protein